MIGVDMTDEQLAVASRHQDSQARRFGGQSSNVDFRQGYIEDLSALGISDDSIDVVISNCVINLSPERERVFAEIFRVLKPGGELYFSDVFAGRRIPREFQNDPLLHQECLGGAMYFEDFRRLLRSVGCLDFRIMARHPVAIGNSEVEARVGMIDFHYGAGLQTCTLGGYLRGLRPGCLLSRHPTRFPVPLHAGRSPYVSDREADAGLRQYSGDAESDQIWQALHHRRGPIGSLRDVRLQGHARRTMDRWTLSRWAVLLNPRQQGRKLRCAILLGKTRRVRGQGRRSQHAEHLTSLKVHEGDGANSPAFTLTSMPDDPRNPQSIRMVDAKRAPQPETCMGRPGCIQN